MIRRLIARSVLYRARSGWDPVLGDAMAEYERAFASDREPRLILLEARLSMIDDSEGPAMRELTRAAIASYRELSVQSARPPVSLEIVRLYARALATIGDDSGAIKTLEAGHDAHLRSTGAGEEQAPLDPSENELLTSLAAGYAHVGREEEAIATYCEALDRARNSELIDTAQAFSKFLEERARPGEAAAVLLTSALRSYNDSALREMKERVIEDYSAIGLGSECEEALDTYLSDRDGIDGDFFQDLPILSHNEQRRGSWFPPRQSRDRR